MEVLGMCLPYVKKDIQPHQLSFPFLGLKILRFFHFF